MNRSQTVLPLHGKRADATLGRRNCPKDEHEVLVGRSSRIFHAAAAIHTTNKGVYVLHPRDLIVQFRVADRVHSHGSSLCLMGCRRDTGEKVKRGRIPATVPSGAC